MDPSHEKYDTALLSILQNEGKVAPFLDVILGFLYRRTDFFRIMKSETDRLGFPPGVALKLLTNIFKKYETMSIGDTVKREKIKNERAQQKTKAVEQKPCASKDSIPQPQSSGATAPNTEPRVAPTEEADVRGQEVKPSPEVTTGSPGTEGSTTEGSTEKMDTLDTSAQEKLDGQKSDTKPGGGEEEEDPEKVRERRALQANPLTYNGADREGYFWSQNIMEVDVRVKVAKHIVKGKQVKVTIKAKHLQVATLDADGQWTELVTGDLAWDVNKEESMWTLSPGEFVHVNLEKKQERWWENVFPDEPKINTRKIDCSRPMEDLDDEAQAKIEEMMYNQRQKQLGRPQSHETKSHDMLRKAWDAEGSPFKGQPFDPSKLSVDQNGVVNINQ